MNLSVSLDFLLDISDYSINSIKISIDGNAQTNVETEVSVQEACTYSWSNQVTTLTIPSIPFSVAGIPMELQINIPVIIGFDANVTVLGSAYVSAGATGSIQYGIAYDGSNWSPINTYSYSQNGSITNIDTGFSAGLTVYLFPTAILYIDYIGGPYIGCKTFLEAGVYSTDDQNCPVALNLNWGLQLTMGINISINFESWQPFNFAVVNPWTIYSVKKPIVQGCLDSSTDSLFEPIPGPLIIGNTWTGTFPPSPDYGNEAGDMSMQLVDMDDDGTYYLVGSFNLNGPTNGACIIQGYWGGNSDGFGDWVFTPITDGSGDNVFWQSCQVGNPFSPSQFQSVFSSDNSTFTIDNNSDNIILYRDMQN
jgi:hypothetical protein